jgi:glycosyltransferase involved in cell wall biosynthesis
MRVLMLTRRMDKDDWLAGFAHGWVKRIAEHPRVDHLDVICLERGSIDLPENVHVTSMGKELSASRLAELWNFQKAISKIIRHTDVIFGHMIPRYTLVAAPWALLYGVPVVQWYTHRQVTLELRIVHALAQRILTASPESFTLPSNKVTVLGHGIDLSHFREAENPPEGRLIASIGRLSPIKHYEALIAAAAELTGRPGYEDVRVAIAGGTTPQNGEAYAQELRTLAQDAGVADRIEFLGPIPHEQISSLYQRAAVTVNLCPTGGVDKAVLESMASSVPVIVRNETFLVLLGDDAESLWVADLNPVAIADKLAAVLDAAPDQRQAIGKRLAARVRAEYDLDQLIDRLVAVLEEASRKRRGG